jgi:hypothetical protein
LKKATMGWFTKIPLFTLSSSNMEKLPMIRCMLTVARAARGRHSMSELLYHVLRQLPFHPRMELCLETKKPPQSLYPLGETGIFSENTPLVFYVKSPHRVERGILVKNP